MRRLAALLALVLASAGCDGGTPVADAGVDAGTIVDSGPQRCGDDVECPGSYCAAATSMGAPRFCCRPTGPEICGDAIDQNCDRMDGSCGDVDRDGSQACRPGEDPFGGGCDCDDERSDVRPGTGDLPGAPELCDGIDNDCNGRVDESAQCCEGCASLGADRDRADLCTTDGACVCSTDTGTGPCEEGRTCCSGGCVDTTSDIMNCGFCNAACTVSADRCTASGCACGDGPPCDLDNACTAGACPE